MNMRPYHPNDLLAYVDMMNRSYAGFGIDTLVTPDFLSARVSDPDFDTGVIEQGSAIIGGIGLNYDAPSSTAWGELLLVPEHRPAAIPFVLAAMEARARALGVEQAAQGTAIKLRVYINGTAEDVIAAFKKHGYDYIRSSYRMEIALDAAFDAAPPAVSGIEIRPFDRQRDVHAAYEAHQSAFADHWEFTRDTFEYWKNMVLNRPGDDNAMWLIAWDGGEIAGFAFNRPAGGAKPDTMWVGYLGVVKAYRQRGLGLALLQHAFQRARERGYTRAALGVDASNTTGAVRLYERAGMRVYLEFVNYQKRLT